MATSPFQSNSLRGQDEEQQLKKQCPSWPTGREVMTTLEFDGNGEVVTRVDMRTTKIKFFEKYLSEGMSDPDKIIRPRRRMFLT